MTEVLIKRELLERCALLLTDSLYPPDGCSGFDDWTDQGNTLAEELRAILATPATVQGVNQQLLEALEKIVQAPPRWYGRMVVSEEDEAQARAAIAAARKGEGK